MYTFLENQGKPTSNNLVLTDKLKNETSFCLQKLNMRH